MTKAIACIGNGFVGGSLTTVFNEKNISVIVYDKGGTYKKGSIPIVAAGTKTGFTDLHDHRGDVFIHLTPNQHSAQYHIQQLVKHCESSDIIDPISKKRLDFTGIYFVCLPTPMYESGEADLSIVESVLEHLAEIPGERIAVIKSTVTPGATEAWNKKFNDKGLFVIHCPEFLTEANALDDMRNQSRIILGGPRPHINKVKQLFQTAFPSVPIIKTSSTTSEMVKYFTNVQLAVRVILSCELSQICDALDQKGFNIDYDKIVEYSKLDSRLGDSHMNVPGSDGIPGARGHCFPKDLNALISLAEMLDLEPKVMKAAWRKNLEIVPPEHRDWEKMVGRATSKKPKAV
jgi:UDPglucose 6-dehydrogenase